MWVLLCRLVQGKSERKRKFERLKTTWLKCSKCAGKIHRKTYQWTTRGLIVCIQCNLKEAKKRKKGHAENTENTRYNRK